MTQRYFTPSVYKQVCSPLVSGSAVVYRCQVQISVVDKQLSFFFLQDLGETCVGGDYFLHTDRCVQYLLLIFLRQCLGSS